jgi:Flp pilus assembly pilin Flp
MHNVYPDYIAKSHRRNPMAFLRDENGQSMVEYAIIIGLIAVAAVVALVLLSPKIRESFGKSDNGIKEVEESN